MDEEDILTLIENDPWMMKVLKVASELNLPDWMIGAGFVRNKVWDYLHGFENSVVPTNDIDLIYFDPENLDEDQEKEFDKILKEKININWSCKNQARMHKKHGDEPYKSTEDALANWVETATTIAVRLEDGELKLFAPHRIDDLVNLILRPTPKFRDPELLQMFKERIEKKGWLKQYPKLTVVYN